MRKKTAHTAHISSGVQLKHLTKQYLSAATPAVDNLSLEVQAGEFVTLLGPSGSGKSTLLNMLAGFSKPTSGSVILDSTDVTRIPPHRRNIGMVFQNYALFPHLSAADNVAFPLRRRGYSKSEAATKAAAALAKVHLGDYSQRKPHELSGGQQQRVAVARAIVFDPRLVLMDEPFGALDKKLREGMQLEMLRLHKDLGVTFIFVTHDQEEALSMSDRIAVMKSGRLEQIGTPTDLYESPNSEFVAGFLGESNLFHGQRTDAVTVQTPLGPIGIETTNVGSDISLLVRPERAHLMPACARVNPSENTLQCTVEQVVYLGSARRVIVRFADGSTGIVRENSHTIADLHVGTIADFRWSVTDGHVITSPDSEMVQEDIARAVSQ